MENKELLYDEMAHAKWPDSYIGRWVATEEYGTHDPTDVAVIGSTGVMTYETEEHGIMNEKLSSKDGSFTRKIVQIKKHYPTLTVRIFCCGWSEEELKQKIEAGKK